MSAAVTTDSANLAYPTFKLVRRQAIDALSIEVFEYQHIKTGAIHYHLAAPNQENVFLVALRTQPQDSRGVAHILEHTSLCGSKKFPVRDPFFAMIRRSLNTFMNAFTAADWTAYPFATQNKKDFDNLLEVYLDAVFFANLNPLDFAQEGIRVELEDNKPVFKGIVFNEMKGAMSAPSDQLYHTLAHHLYPTTTYHYNSGGDPKDIPDLSYDDLKQFYQSHYHPSNAVFMTFGDRPAAELQQQFEQLALQHFERGQTLYPEPEQRFSQSIQVDASYASDSNDLENKSYHILAWLLPQSNDVELRLALNIIEGLLLEDSSSPLRQYLETANLGQSTGPMMGLDDDHFEMTFMCGIQGSNPEQKNDFEQGVLQVLNQVASGPIPRAQVEVILHQIELQQREVGGDGMPYGLNLILNGLGSAIHHGDPIAVWDVDQALASIRVKLEDEMWLPQLIQQHLIDNAHRVCLTLIPDANQTELEQKLEQQRLAEIEQNLTEQSRQALIDQAAALAERQATQDDLSILPKVGLEDVPAELKPVDFNIKKTEIGNEEIELWRYPSATNGLFYLQMLIDISPELANSAYLPLFNLLVGEVGAGEFNYLQLQQKQTELSGGIGMGLSVRSLVNDAKQLNGFAHLNTKALQRNLAAIDLQLKSFVEIRLDEKQRIIELIKQRKSSWYERITGVGHRYAMQTAARHLSAVANRDYHCTGLPVLRWLDQLTKQIEQDPAAFDQLVTELTLVQQQLLQAKKRFLIVAEAEQMSQVEQHLSQVWSKQKDTIKTQLPSSSASSESKSQIDDELAWLIQTNVQFCASAYPTVAVDHPDAAILMVLSAYLRNGFLHSAIREKGGAYGGGATYDSNSCAFTFFSYRDPRLSETFADFQASLDWLQNEEQLPTALEEAILGLIAAMDNPGSPAGEAISHCYAHLHGRDLAFRQQLRQSILDVSLADLRRVADLYLQPENQRRAVVAPFDKADEVTALGFQIERLDI